MSNPSSIVELGRAEVSAQNEGLARTLKGARPRLMQAVAEIKSNLSTIAGEPEHSAISFMALLCRLRHLSAHSAASDESGGDGRAGGRLTCLSVRCLSSYLIFSASSSDKQAAGQVRRREARLTRAPSPISPLI